jgi:hypothetical protein
VIVETISDSCGVTGVVAEPAQSPEGCLIPRGERRVRQ